MKYLIKYDTMEDFYEHEGQEVICEGVLAKSQGQELTYAMSYDASEQAITEITVAEMDYPDVENVILENGDYVCFRFMGSGQEEPYNGIYVETNQTGTTAVTEEGETYEIEYRIYTAKTGQGTLYGIEKVIVGGEVVSERGDGAQALLDLANLGSDMFALIKYKADNADCVTSIVPGVATLADNTEKVFYNAIPEVFEVVVESWIDNDLYSSLFTLVSSITYTAKNVPLSELISVAYDSEDSHEYRNWTFSGNQGDLFDEAEIDLYDEMPTVDDAVAAIKDRDVRWKYYDFQTEKFKSQANGQTLKIMNRKVRTA